VMQMQLKKLMEIMEIMKDTITNKNYYSEKLKKGIHFGCLF
jgi:hypothetical protein